MTDRKRAMWSRTEIGPAPRRPVSRAFTLLEVLVGVAIISLLAAVLLPSLSAARVQSRRVACAAGLKQLALAWDQYLQAHQGRFYRGPVNANLNYGGRQGLGSPQFQGPKPLNPHAGLPAVVSTGAEVFRCPSDAGSGAVQPAFFEFVGTSYVTNGYLVGQDNFRIYEQDPCAEVLKRLRDRLPRLNRAQVAGESRLVLMGDMGWVEAAHFNSELHLEWHGRKASYNFAFLDGHAEFLSVRKGLQVTSRYTVIPFRELQQAAAAVQQEVSGP